MSETTLILHLIGILLFLVWIIILIRYDQNNTGDDTIKRGSVVKSNDVNDNAIFNFYSQVKMNQFKAEVDDILGAVPEVDEDGLYTYVDTNTGYGVCIAYNDRERVTLKGISTPECESELIALGNMSVTPIQVASIKEGMSYEEVKRILGGAGIEVICVENQLDRDKLLYGMAWINKDGTAITVQLDGYKGTAYTAKFREK
ncbi:hypothetical protein [Acetobacterium tundrae]|uniref:DUF5590 domain-containing protein n=1 Tax=Acetobacterium tundrae TaxID=132932 RepID=A0ABR6WJG1_9FIRM|nr:hypothetical protein [Acetobacterium tundrae]MBC3796634.1 hypothetical protein [Acetobacterium tundrae]